MSMILVPFRATQGPNRPGPAGIRNQMGCPTGGFISACFMGSELDG